MLGLALSGGGVKGFAHIGAIKALEKIGYTPDIISGSSVGAIVGSLYAKGLSLDEIMSIGKNMGLIDVFKPINPINGLSSMKRLEKAMNPYLGKTYFGKLKKKLIITATDYKQGKPVYFTKGRVIPAVMASSCIPGIFKPYRIKKGIYIDGELTDPLPVSVIKNEETKVISLTLQHLNPQLKRVMVVNIISRAMKIMRHQLVIESERKADLAIRLPTYDYEVLRIKQPFKLYRIGYDSVMRQKKLIKKLLNDE